MTIGKVLSDALEGLTIEVQGTEVSVQNNYGKQDALDKFIAECDKKGAKKFPLVFYVTDRVTDTGLKLECDTSIVIMTNTDNNWLSKKRTSETFDKILSPIYEKVIKLIERSDDLGIYNRRSLLSYEDVSNYGIVKGDIGQKKSGSSVVSDFIDARVIKLKIEFTKS